MSDCLTFAKDNARSERVGALLLCTTRRVVILAHKYSEAYSRGSGAYKLAEHVRTRLPCERACRAQLLDFWRKVTYVVGLRVLRTTVSKLWPKVLCYSHRTSATFANSDDSTRTIFLRRHVPVCAYGLPTKCIHSLNQSTGNMQTGHAFLRCSHESMQPKWYPC